jgi:hypothetical protein
MEIVIKIFTWMQVTWLALLGALLAVGFVIPAPPESIVLPIIQAMFWTTIIAFTLCLFVLIWLAWVWVSQRGGSR